MLLQSSVGGTGIFHTVSLFTVTYDTNSLRHLSDRTRKQAANRNVEPRLAQRKEGCACLSTPGKATSEDFARHHDWVLAPGAPVARLTKVNLWSRPRKATRAVFCIC